MAPKAICPLRKSQTSHNINRECQRVNTKRSYQRDCHARQTFELDYSCRQSAEVGEAVTLHILCINCCLNSYAPHTHTHIHTLYIALSSHVVLGTLRSASVRELDYAKQAELTSCSRRRNWQAASGKRQATSCFAFLYNWPKSEFSMFCVCCFIINFVRLLLLLLFFSGRQLS